MSEILDWFYSHQSFLAWLGAASVFTFVGSLFALPWLVSRIPEDYFLHSRRHPTHWKESHPAVRTLLLAGKNLLGAVLLLGGLMMLFLPGQGLLTIAMGILLLDYPGKFRLEQRFVSSPAILNSLNWLRAKTNHPPLQVDDPE